MASRLGPPRIRISRHDRALSSPWRRAHGCSKLTIPDGIAACPPRLRISRHARALSSPARQWSCSIGGPEDFERLRLRWMRDCASRAMAQPGVHPTARGTHPRVGPPEVARGPQRPRSLVTPVVLLMFRAKSTGPGKPLPRRAVCRSRRWGEMWCQCRIRKSRRRCFHVAESWRLW